MKRSYTQRIWLTTTLLLPLLAFGIALASLARVAPATAHIALGMPVEHSTALPLGLILPVTLAQTISVEHAQAGQPIEARIMQDVPLTLHDKIPAKSRISGAIVAVTKAADEHGVELSLRFDKVEFNKDMIPTLTSLRVMASREAVREAQTPSTGADGGTPTGWADTVQIGGDNRFGDGGKVRSRFKQTVGKGIAGGVLVHVHARPGTDCDGPVNGDDRLQALWVFSSDACGVYGISKVEIAHSGKTDPVGVITLKFEKADAKLDAGTAMLLRVVAPK
ncbi:MAG: hypothetical protein WCE52_19870 [Candidatus Acidiferrum sp.]